MSMKNKRERRALRERRKERDRAAREQAREDMRRTMDRLHDWQDEINYQYHFGTGLSPCSRTSR